MLVEAKVLKIIWKYQKINMKQIIVGSTSRKRNAEKQHRAKTF